MEHRGLTAAALKWIALAAMTLDHLGLWAEVFGLPADALRGAGRIAAPIFLFLLTESLRKTRSRPRLLLRLLLCAECHAVCAQLLIRATGFSTWYGNILFPFLYVGLFACAAEGARARDFRPAALFFGAVLLGALLPKAAAPFFPALWDADYGALFFLMGALFYLLPAARPQLLLAFSLLSLLLPAAAAPLVSALRLTPMCTPLQPLMALAAPLLLCYRGERGKSSKLFFYLYYPLHQYALLLAACLIKSA